VGNALYVSTKSTYDSFPSAFLPANTSLSTLWWSAQLLKIRWWVWLMLEIHRSMLQWGFAVPLASSFAPRVQLRLLAIMLAGHGLPLLPAVMQCITQDAKQRVLHTQEAICCLQRLVYHVAQEVFAYKLPTAD
jgi:hypothetical protein